MELIFNAELKNDTPVFLGGYDTLYYRDGSSEGLRSQSVKGLMRYWMRVYYATQGYNLDEISEETNNILGGKSKDGKELITSKVKIRCYTKCDEPSYIQGIQDILNNIPRIKLLKLRKDDKLNYAKKLESELSLYVIRDNLNDNNKKLIIGSLVTGIILSGIGKMSRRGFGCFSMKIKEDCTSIFQKNINGLFESDDLNDKKTSIINIIKETRKCIQPKRNYGNVLPPIHSFSHCKMYIIKVQDKMKTIQDLQEFTVRSLRQRSLRQIKPYQITNQHHARLDQITNQHAAWFLGLPREQRGTGYTGYNINNNRIERRASPMFIAVHNNFAIITIFKSKDWPTQIRWTQIRWKGKNKPQPIDVMKANYIEAINNAYGVIDSELNRYLRNKGYQVEEIDSNQLN